MESNVFNDLVVVKRSGQRVPFNGTKIAIAIKKAFDSVYTEHNENNVNKIYNIVLKYISDNYTDRKTITVEAVQDIIEYILKQEKFEDVYRSFNTYRLKRKASREIFDRKQQHKFIKSTEKLILTVQDEEKPPLELLFDMGKTISNEFSKSYLIDYKYIRSHDEGNIFIHDLDYYVLGSTFSTHLDFNISSDMDLFFENILRKLLNIKKEQCGEHTITSIDHIFIPWLIYMFKKTYKNILCYSLDLNGYIKYINIKKIEEIIDKMDTIYFDINVFEKYMYSDNVKNIFKFSYNKTLEELENKLKLNITNLLNNLEQYEYKINNDSNYSISLGSNHSKEGDFISRIYLNILLELPRLNNVTTIYKVTNKFNPLLEFVCHLIVMNKNIAFNYINASFNKRMLLDEQYKSEVEYFSNGERILENISDKTQYSVGRSIISKVSINLVRVALESKSIKEFYSNLDDILEFSKNELLQSFEYLSSKYKKNYKYLFSNQSTDNDKSDEDKKIRKSIKNGTLNIGYVGLKETICLLLNKEDITGEDLKLGIDIIKFIKEKCDKYTDEFKLNFVPCETVNKDVLEYFYGIDKSVYGTIKNVTDSNYIHFYNIFDRFKISMDERLKIESKIQKYSSGGYYEIINIPKNYSYKKVIEIVNNMKDYDIGYFKIIVGKLE